ncbi:hypothetical protein [Yersinia ruckeri]|uniref:hypothetical protein n=1 Tax=Yersinia ruckeri TaxID=29486 RepID=UPI0028F42F66|nr:hypothetical protein [Yersinia ruckeri]
MSRSRKSRRRVRTDTPNSAASFVTLRVSPATRRPMMSDSLTASLSWRRSACVMEHSP